MSLRRQNETVTPRPLSRLSSKQGSSLPNVFDPLRGAGHGRWISQYDEASCSDQGGGRVDLATEDHRNLASEQIADDSAESCGNNSHGHGYDSARARQEGYLSSDDRE